MAYSYADPAAKCIENDLSGHKEKYAKGNITEWPSVLQGPGYQELHAHVNEQFNGVEQVQNDK